MGALGSLVLRPEKEIDGRERPTITGGRGEGFQDEGERQMGC